MSDTPRAAFIERMLDPYRKVRDAELKMWADSYEALEAKLSKMEEESGWMKRVLLRVPRTYWMQWVEGPWYATGDMDELQFFRALAGGEEA